MHRIFDRPQPKGTRRRGQNPFQTVPLPKPLEGWNLRASEIFRERALARHLDHNAAWLQANPRTTETIHDALFPEYDPCGMEPEDILQLLNRALWDAGYTPTDDGTTPVWFWNEGDQE